VGNYNGTFTLDNFNSGGNDGTHCSIYAFGSYAATIEPGGIPTTVWWLYQYTATTTDGHTWTITVIFRQTGFGGSGAGATMAEWQTTINCEDGDTFPTGGDTLELPLIYNSACWTAPATITIGCPSGGGDEEEDKLAMADTSADSESTATRKPCGNCGNKRDLSAGRNVDNIA
jgi:hypothetical protein